MLNVYPLVSYLPGICYTYLPCTFRVHTPAEMAMPGENCQTCNGTTVLRGTLPREPVCTENLIPLIKMLPCRSKVSGR